MVVAAAVEEEDHQSAENERRSASEHSRLCRTYLVFLPCPNTAENFETLSSLAKNQLESWRLSPCDPDLANVLFAGFSALLVDMLQCLKGNL
jgi:hypothetical protein